jgi:SAM-dependent methyltransferase
MGADYHHPWRQELLEVSGESLFDALLEHQLSKDKCVLEAGCAGGRDAERVAAKVRDWIGYDFVPQFLKTARDKHIPNASFVDWHSSREPIPDEVLDRAPFDLVVSRRGPTSIIQHLPALTSPLSKFIYVGPRGMDLLEEVCAKLELIRWQMIWSAVVEARGFLPTFEDYALHAEFNGLDYSNQAFEFGWTEQGFSFLETRCVVMAAPS